MPAVTDLNYYNRVRKTLNIRITLKQLLDLKSPVDERALCVVP